MAERTVQIVKEGGGRSSRSKPSKLTIDEYVDVLHNQNRLDHLTVDHLNQIIDMHGFQKIHKTHKRILIEAVKHMELMDPCRSTLQDDDVSSDAFIPLNEIVKDLNEIKWQECCVTSLVTVNSVNLPHHQGGESVNNVGGGSTNGTSILSAASVKPRRKRKSLRKLAQTGGGKDIVPPGFKLRGSDTSSCSVPAVVNWGLRRKRAYVNLSENGNDGVGVAATAAAGEVQVQPPVIALDA